MGYHIILKKLLDNEDSLAFGAGHHPRGPSGCPKSIGPLSGPSGPRLPRNLLTKHNQAQSGSHISC